MTLLINHQKPISSILTIINITSPNLGKSWLPDPFNHLISQGEVHASLTGSRIQCRDRAQQIEGFQIGPTRHAHCTPAHSAWVLRFLNLSCIFGRELRAVSCWVHTAFICSFAFMLISCSILADCPAHHLRTPKCHNPRWPSWGHWDQPNVHSQNAAKVLQNKPQGGWFSIRQHFPLAHHRLRLGTNPSMLPYWLTTLLAGQGL